MSLGIGAAPLAGPRAAVTGDSDAGPGKAVRNVFRPAEMCQDMMALACAAILPVAVPIAAIFGAVAKTSQKLPLEQVVQLNRTTAVVASQLNLSASFRTALEDEAKRRGITLLPASSQARVVVSFQSLSWNIKAGNRVALRMELEVTVRLDGKRGSRQVIYRSGSASVDDWVADNGEPIREVLRDAMVGVSKQAWERILGAERDGN